jgi:DNA mismatch repair protein MutS
LEQQGESEGDQKRVQKGAGDDSPQASLFEQNMGAQDADRSSEAREHPALSKLAAVEVDNLSPREALELLYEVQELLSRQD